MILNKKKIIKKTQIRYFFHYKNGTRENQNFSVWNKKTVFGLKKSINMAVRKRPVENSQVEQIVYQITHQIAINNELEITSAKIGEMVLEALEKLDQVAFVRFASVYKNFKTPQDFQQFIKKIV